MSRPLRLVKMSGAGNDFIVLGPDAREAVPPEAEVAWVRRVCRRGLSVGADGVLWVEPLRQALVGVRFRNPDGSEAFCGNGSRCAARFAFEQGFAPRRMTLETAIGKIPAEVLDDGVRVELPPPRDNGEEPFDLDGLALAGRSVFAGTPHWVAAVERLAEAPLERWARSIRHDPRFAPGGTNVDLMQVEGPRVRLRTYEKGVERETLSCGSGAVAVAFMHRLSGAAAGVEVLPASGIPLRVEFAGPADRPESVVLHGDARVVFETTLGKDATTGFPEPEPDA